MAFKRAAVGAAVAVAVAAVAVAAVEAVAVLDRRVTDPDASFSRFSRAIRAFTFA